MIEHFQTAYFISDAHIGAGSREEEFKKINKLLTFLDNNINSDTGLFILGDLFDFWFEYKNVIPRAGIRLMAKLIELARCGVRIRYIGGNHDFWIGERFLNEIGIPYFDSEVECTIRGKNFFIAHGDNLPAPDFMQRLLNATLRSPLNIRLYRLLHPDIGLAFGRMVARMIRKNSSKRHPPSELFYVQFAENHFKRGIDYVVMGHTHRPFINKNGEHGIMNIGDWIDHNTYGYFDGKTLTLNEWKGNGLKKDLANI